MANVLGELFSNIAAAIRIKTGDVATMKPAEFPDKILSINANSAPQETVVMEEQDCTFVSNPAYGCYMWEAVPALFDMTIGAKYRVIWDGNSYECTAVDGSSMSAGAVLMGNLAIVGGADTGEPFAFAYLPAVGDGVEYDSNVCLTTSTDSLHTITIVKVAENRNFTIASGGFMASDTQMTVNHDIGEVPDIMIIYTANMPVGNTLSFSVGFSSAMHSALGGGYIAPTVFIIENDDGNAAMTASNYQGMEHDLSDESLKLCGCVHNVTNATFDIGGTTYGLNIDGRYSWLAICGLI